VFLVSPRAPVRWPVLPAPFVPGYPCLNGAHEGVVAGGPLMEPTSQKREWGTHLEFRKIRPPACSIGFGGIE